MWWLQFTATTDFKEGILMDRFNPNFYKELPDDSAMIQAAVDAASSTGEMVTIPRINERTGKNVWEIERAIKLYSGSTVCLENCTLRQADGVYENIFKNSNNGTPLGFTREGRQKDIRIFGVGNAVLDGGNHNGLTEVTQKEPGMPWVISNCMFNFLNVERVHIENLRIVNQRYWSMVFHYCSYGHIRNIDFYAPKTVRNQDGIDLRTGCNNFIIENITGVTGDDTVALTCLKSRFDDDIKGAGFDDAIHHVIIRNICSSTPCSLVRLLNHYGKLLYNIIIENIMESSERDISHERGKENEPLDKEKEKLRVGACVRIGENFYCEAGNRAKLCETYNITVKNVIGRMRTAVRASCALSNAVFENIQIYGEGGTAVFFGEGEMKNITVLNIGYPLCHSPNDTDDNRLEKHYNQIDVAETRADRKLCAVYFNETNAENIIFRDIYASDKLTAVFGGNGSVKMKAENVVRQSETLPLFDKDLKVEKMLADNF